MTEAQLPPSWDGSVVLDIGGEIGALLLRTPSTMNGLEIELEPEGAHTTHTHSAVRERRLLGGVAYAAVYPSLKAGNYTVAGSGQTVTIVGGQVTETEYRDS